VTRILQLTPLAKVRVWFGEKLTAGIVAEGVLAASLPQSADSSRPKTAWAIGVEALVPRGGRAEYGLLAVTFVPRDSGPIHVEVPHSSATGTAWAGSLAGTLDDVRTGLPHEYAAAVLESLSSAANGQLSPGLLRVSEAAHGAAGSSARFFGKLGRAVVALAALSGSETLEDDGVAKLRTILVG